MYLTQIILPLLGAIISGFLGRKIGIQGSQIITTSCVFATTTLATLTYLEVCFNNIPVNFSISRWLDCETILINWGFNFDSLTVSMLIPVLIVSLLVHIYSIGYMSHDPHIQRFFSYLSLFTFMMIILVTADNYLLMFVGWEGVGVCSYLLVSFWFTRIAANQSSLSAFLTNRVGDAFLTVGMFAIILTFGNLDYATVFSLSAYISEDVLTIIGICLLIGAMAKSSQIGLHVWLPMAMEGPTPVSALIHAATMVTAGVYLLMRSSPLLEYSSTVLILALWIGGITTIFSSLVGLFQQDIKKVIAYSTMSQLGMMVIAVGLSSYTIALFHLINHAFYKALLFLAAGSVIHGVGDNQDFRKYGGLRSLLPLTYSVMLIASLSLVAFPFMTGFYSKDLILESAYGEYSYYSQVIYFIATIGALFTSLYSVKVLYITFLTNPNGALINYTSSALPAHNSNNFVREGNWYMSLPLIVLAVFSIVFGYITKDIYVGLASSAFIDNSLYLHPEHESFINTEFSVPIFYKLLPFILTVCATIISIYYTEFCLHSIIKFKLTRFGYNIFSFFNQRFLIEKFYNKYITDFVLDIGGQTTKFIDKGAVERLGAYGLEVLLTNISSGISKLNTQLVTSYALFILIGLLLYLSILVYEIKFDILFIMGLCLLHLAKTNTYIVRKKALTIKNKWDNFNLFCLTNPPKPHAFVNSPVQSTVPFTMFFKLNFNKQFSINIISSKRNISLYPKGLIFKNGLQHIQYLVNMVNTELDNLLDGVQMQFDQAEELRLNILGPIETEQYDIIRVAIIEARDYLVTEANNLAATPGDIIGLEQLNRTAIWYTKQFEKSIYILFDVINNNTEYDLKDIASDFQMELCLPPHPSLVSIADIGKQKYNSKSNNYADNIPKYSDEYLDQVTGVLMLLCLYGYLDYDYLMSYHNFSDNSDAESQNTQTNILHSDGNQLNTNEQSVASNPEHNVHEGGDIATRENLGDQEQQPLSSTDKGKAIAEQDSRDESESATQLLDDWDVRSMEQAVANSKRQNHPLNTSGAEAGPSGTQNLARETTHNLARETTQQNPIPETFNNSDNLNSLPVNSGVKRKREDTSDLDDVVSKKSKFQSQSENTGVKRKREDTSDLDDVVSKKPKLDDNTSEHYDSSAESPKRPVSPVDSLIGDSEPNLSSPIREVSQESIGAEVILDLENKGEEQEQDNSDQEESQIDKPSKDNSDNSDDPDHPDSPNGSSGGSGGSGGNFPPSNPSGSGGDNPSGSGGDNPSQGGDGVSSSGGNFSSRIGAGEDIQSNKGLFKESWLFKFLFGNNPTGILDDFADPNLDMPSYIDPED